jgi:hypothetical protein
LVLPNQDFVADDKLREGKVTLSFRKRNLFKAVLDRASLQQADFTGANLQGTSLVGAKLQGVILDHAELQGASLNHAELQGAHLDETKLQGALLDAAKLQGALLHKANLQGASLDLAKLQSASLLETKLQGASLDRAELQGALLLETKLQGASLDRAELQGALLYLAELQSTWFHCSYVFRIEREEVSFAKTYVKGLHKSSPPDDEEIFGVQRYQKYVDGIVAMVPDFEPGTKEYVRTNLARLAPNFQTADQDTKDATFWTEAEEVSGRTPLSEHQKALATILTEVVCASDPAVAPHVVRGLIRHGRLTDTGPEFVSLAEHMKNPAKCPGSNGFARDDFALFEKLIKSVKEHPLPTRVCNDPK